MDTAFSRTSTILYCDLSLKEVSSRLADYILAEQAIAKSDCFIMNITKSELAHKLGTISATLSRNLRKFREIGAIEVDGRQITILDSERLEAIADGEKI